MIAQSRGRSIGCAFVMVLIVALVQSMTLAQTPGGAIVATGETEVHKSLTDQVQGLPEGTRVRLTLEDGAEIEGDFVRVSSEWLLPPPSQYFLVLRKHRMTKGQLTTDAITLVNDEVRLPNATVASIRVPAWARSAAHRLDDNFLYEVVDVGFGQTPGWWRRVWARGRSSMAIRPSPPGFWLALRVTNLSIQHRTGRMSQMPLVSLRSVSALDDAKNEYSVRSATLIPPVYTDERRGGWWPGSFSIELLHIPASELVDGIKELQVTIHDSPSAGGPRTRHVFAIKNPQSLKRDFKVHDFDYMNSVADAENPPVEARTFTSLR